MKCYIGIFRALVDFICKVKKYQQRRGLPVVYGGSFVLVVKIKSSYLFFRCVCEFYFVIFVRHGTVYQIVICVLWLVLDRDLIHILLDIQVSIFLGVTVVR